MYKSEEKYITKDEGGEWRHKACICGLCKIWRRKINSLNKPGRLVDKEDIVHNTGHKHIVSQYP